MCLAVPGLVLTISGNEPLTRTGRVEFLGVTREVTLALLPDVQVNDYVLVHAGVAITILDESEAQQTLKYLQQMGETIEPTDTAPLPK